MTAARPGQIQRLPSPVKESANVAEIGVQVVRRPGRIAGQQRAGVGQDHGIVVDVDDPALRRDRLRDLMHAPGGRQAGPEVEELADAGLGDQVAHRPGQEIAVRPHRRRQVGIGGHRVLGGGPVDRVVVLTAPPVVLHPGDVRHARIESGRMLAWHSDSPALAVDDLVERPPVRILDRAQRPVGWVTE